LLYFVLEIEKGPIHPPSWSIDPYTGVSQKGGKRERERRAMRWVGWWVGIENLNSV